MLQSRLMDAFGNLTKQTDAVYDELGRMIRRTEAEGISHWKYDTREKVRKGVRAEWH